MTRMISPESVDAQRPLRRRPVRVVHERFSIARVLVDIAIGATLAPAIIGAGSAVFLGGFEGNVVVGAALVGGSVGAFAGIARQIN